jgi:tetratricopeptide (TPR) repeat protein
MARRAPGKIVWVAGGFGAIVILAGVGWWFLGRGNAPPRATAAPPPAPRRAAIGSQRPGTAPAAVGSAAPAASASDRPTSELLAEARTAIASRDYGAAVLAYNEILGKEPDNAEAKDGLARAGEDYKARKAEIEQLDRVKMAFAEQEFTSALHVLYRFPKTADKSVIDRYKVNGWYNLGIVALKGGGCAEARSHFDEALAIGSGDEGVRRLRSFAERYVETSKDRAFYDQVESLSFRGVDE